MPGFRIYSKEDTIRLKLFCDESGPVNDWFYLAILFVPEQFEEYLITTLLNLRCGNQENFEGWVNCNRNCTFHDRNNSEIHFKEIKVSKSGHKLPIAEKWIEFFLHEVDKIYFYVFGIDLSKLDSRYFGEKRIEENIYNRFFRTAILGAAKSYFRKYDKIIISEITHDQSKAKECHRYFSWHPIFRMGRDDPKLFFETSEIKFLNSDHRMDDGDLIKSNFLQFVDLLLGCIRQCLDRTSNDKYKDKLALQAFPLIQRLINSSGNINSSYKYVNRLGIQFFPKHDISKVSNPDLLLIKKHDSFYSKRELAICHRNQPTLFSM